MRKTKICMHNLSCLYHWYIPPVYTLNVVYNFKISMPSNLVKTLVVSKCSMLFAPKTFGSTRGAGITVDPCLCNSDIRETDILILGGGVSGRYVLRFNLNIQEEYSRKKGKRRGKRRGKKKKKKKKRSDIRHGTETKNKNNNAMQYSHIKCAVTIFNKDTVANGRTCCV